MSTPEPVKHPSVSVSPLWREGAAVFVLIWAQLLHPGISTATYLFLAAWALLGRRHALQALSLNVVVAFLNPGLFPGQPYGAVLKWVVLLAAASRVHIEAMLRPRGVAPPVLFLLLFTTIALGLSFVTSYELSVSVFKLTAFLLGASTVLIAFRQSEATLGYWPNWFFTLFLVVLASSLPLLPFRVGHFVNGFGFQGILNHPQAYGAFVAPLTSLAAAAWMAGGGRIDLAGGAAALGLVTLLASEARTAALALFLAFVITLGTALALRRDWLRDMGGFLRHKTSLTLACVLTVAVIVQAEAIQQKVAAFMSKSNRVHSHGLVDDFQRSRGGLVQLSWANFREHPLGGIGFGVASDPARFKVRRDPVFGLPIGAAVEKGFMPTAVLEETGVIGALVLLLLLGSMAVATATRGTFLLSWLFWTCLFINSGEMVFFAMGGLGMYVWLLMGLACASGGVRGRLACA